MKTIIITCIAAFALANAAMAHTWFWFHGDIGTSSPFVSSTSPVSHVATRGAKPKLLSNRGVAANKSKTISPRITAR
jgi:hypothetical protein